MLNAYISHYYLIIRHTSVIKCPFTDTTLTLSNLSTVINLVSNMDNVMDCLSIPLSVKRKIIEHSKDEKQQRDECVYYWRNVSPYSMIGWGFLGGDLHSEGQEAALRAAKKYILWAPGTWYVYVLECRGCL